VCRDIPIEIAIEIDVHGSYKLDICPCKLGQRELFSISPIIVAAATRTWKRIISTVIVEIVLFN